MRNQQRANFAIDLTGIPPQPAIPKCSGRVKDGASEYTGVGFHKQVVKWQAQIVIDAKKYNVGYYDNDGEAAVDYARALFKNRGQGALDNVTMFTVSSDGLAIMIIRRKRQRVLKYRKIRE